MKQKKGIPDFDFSEPEFLISCLDRHKDWAVIICLVGGGQEINTGEAGISEWLHAIDTTFPIGVFIFRLISLIRNMQRWRQFTF